LAYRGRKLTGVPKPVTASQPACAGKPVVPHPVADPEVMSVNAADPTEYNHGFMNPRTGLPDARRLSLTSAMTDAAVGADALFVELERI